MRKEYDLSNARRAKDIPHLAKLQQAMSRENLSVRSASSTTRDSTIYSEPVMANPAFAV